MRKAVTYLVLGIALLILGTYIYPEKEPEQKPIVKQEPVKQTTTNENKIVVSRGEERKPEYKETFIANISAYTQYDEGCDEITASGTKVKANHTIAMDKRYPMGTRVKIEGLPYIFVKEDNGGAIKGNKIDRYMNTVKEANKWGRQYRRVWILEDEK